MNFTNYPNIEAIANNLGGIKKTIFNKTLTKNAEKSWEQFSEKEMEQINKEAEHAVKALTSYVTPTVLMVMNKNEFALLALPVKDIIWIYANIEKHTVNYVIPTGKVHTINIVMRDGSIHSIGYINTSPFSKKDITGEAIKTIYDTISPNRKGVICGWSEEICELVREHFGEAIKLVDSKSSN